MMKRRDFITLLGGAAATWPLAARAQQSALPVIGYLGTEAPERWGSRLQAFRQGLGETGYVEGRNVVIEYRWAESRNDRLPALATELVARKVNVIVALSGTPAARAAKASTATIPIVFVIGNDPVQMGLVTSLNQPGSNITGVTTLAGEIGAKRLELLHEVVPEATVIALLVNPTNPAAETQATELQPAARTLGLQLHVLRAAAERQVVRRGVTLYEPVYKEVRACCEPSHAPSPSSRCSALAVPPPSARSGSCRVRLVASARY